MPVIERRPLSASHIKLWYLCPRREAFVYRQGLREPDSDAATAGTKTHELLEKPDQLKGDEKWKKYEIGKMATLLKAEAPADIVAREQVLTLELDGITYTARIDFQTDRAVGDYKTTSKPTGVLALDKLEDDIQRLLYQQVTGRPDSFWLYGVWKDFSVHPRIVAGDIKRDREKYKLHVLTLAEEILSTPQDVDPLALEPNMLSCSLFPPKGCPFASRCYDPATGEIRRPSQKKQDMSILDAYKAPEEKTPTQPTAAEKKQPPSLDKCIGTLYLDCYPVKGVEGQVVHAGPMIARAAQSVCDDAHVLHSHLVEFGKGKHMLAAQLKHDIKTAGVFYPHLYLETRSELGKDCLFELSDLAVNVVKGMI